MQVTGLTSGVTAIVAGWQHSCAVHNGAAKCWGYGGNGQLGNGGTSNSNTPVQVTGLTSGVTAISARGSHTCAVHNGIAKCWGWSIYGQLGNGKDNTTQGLTYPDYYYESTPVAVHISAENLNSLSGVTAIAAGWQHSCAVHNGAVKCWGWGANGRLGNGGTADSNTPVQVTGLTSGVTAISLYDHSCAVHNGAAKCWGKGGNGQLGNGGTTDSTTPVQVKDINGTDNLDSDVTDISAGANHSCAVHNGAAKCWGSGFQGQLGNGRRSNSSTPVAVSGL